MSKASELKVLREQRSINAPIRYGGRRGDTENVGEMLDVYAQEASAEEVYLCSEEEERKEAFLTGFRAYLRKVFTVNERRFLGKLFSIEGSLTKITAKMKAEEYAYVKRLQEKAYANVKPLKKLVTLTGWSEGEAYVETVFSRLQELQAGKSVAEVLPQNVKREEFRAYRKAYQKAYREKPEVREYMKAYREKPEFREYIRAYMKAYRQRPEVKEAKRLYEQCPEVKERKRLYNRRPEVKAKKQEYEERRKADGRKAKYMQEYNQRPEVRERARARDRERARKKAEAAGRVYKPHNKKAAQATPFPTSEMETQVFGACGRMDAMTYIARTFENRKEEMKEAFFALARELMQKAREKVFAGETLNHFYETYARNAVAFL